MKKYTVILFLEIFIFIGSSVQAKWLQTNGPYSGIISRRYWFKYFCRNLWQ